MNQQIIPLCCCVALIGVALAVPAALACTIPAHSAVSCMVDADGCEFVQGINVQNECNSAARADGTLFRIHHGFNNATIPMTSSFGAWGTGASSYASLYCSNDPHTVLFRGEIANGQTKECDPHPWPHRYAFRSVCGPKQICSTK